MALRATNVPLPTGYVVRVIAEATGAQVAWPTAENYILGGASTSAQIGPFRSTERFWLVCGASFIHANTAAGWVRMDYQLRLLVNGAYGNDLRSTNFFMKTDSIENHADWWKTSSVSGLFYCERNTDYHVRLMSKNTAASGIYWRGDGNHWTIWGYTVGEGKYEMNTSGP